MGEVIISGFDNEQVSPWVLSAYEQGYLDPAEMAVVDRVSGSVKIDAETELLQQAARSAKFSQLLEGIGGLSGLRQQAEAAIQDDPYL